MNTAIALVFLMDGFNACHGWWCGDDQTAEDNYEYHSGRHGGYIGIIFDMGKYAKWVEAYLDSVGPDKNFPGVFHYEVTEALGKWIFDNPDATFAEFDTYALPYCQAWFANGLAAHLAATRLLDPVPGPAVPADNNPTLNASQPADATKKESTTMKISDLMSQLNTLHAAHGDVDVIIRGAGPTTFTDVQEVRRVKTAKREAVYIGKTTPAKHAQE